MRAWKKTALVISGCLIGAGAICTGIGLANGGSTRYAISLDSGYIDYSQTQKREKRVIDQLGSFERISIDIDDADIRILPTRDREAYIETTLGEKQLQCLADKGTLSIQEVSASRTPGFYPPFLSFGTGNTNPEDGLLTLYLPEELEPEWIEVNSEYGELALSQISCGELTLTADSDNVFLHGIQSNSISLELEYGNVSLENVTAGTLSARLECGDYDAQNLETTTLTLYSEYGDVTWNAGSIQSGTIHVEDGSTALHQVQVTDQLEINSEYGDILFESQDGPDAYSYDLSTDYGEISVGKKRYGYGILNEKPQAPALMFRTEDGDITLK